MVNKSITATALEEIPRLSVVCETSPGYVMLSPSALNYVYAGARQGPQSIHPMILMVSHKYLT